MESSLINFVEKYQVYEDYAKDSILGLDGSYLSPG
jgi:hypothetical protein